MHLNGNYLRKLNYPLETTVDWQSSSQHGDLKVRRDLVPFMRIDARINTGKVPELLESTSSMLRPELN